MRPAIMPRLRMRRISASRSGGSIGSPPPRDARAAAREGTARGPEIPQFVDAAEHRLGRYRGRYLVVLVAVTAVDVAAADGDDLDEERVGGRDQATRDLADRACFTADAAE